MPFRTGYVEGMSQAAADPMLNPSPLDDALGGSQPLALDDPRGFVPMAPDAALLNLVAEEAFAIRNDFSLWDRVHAEEGLTLTPGQVRCLAERIEAIGYHLGDGVAFDIAGDLAARASF